MKKPRKGKVDKAPKINERPVVEGVVWCSDVERVERQWLIRDRIPAHVTSIIEGRKESGKSTLLTAIVAAYTGGPSIPGWEGIRDGRVLWLAGEEDWGTEIRPRLEAAAANIDRIGYAAIPTGNGERRSPRLPSDLRRIWDLMGKMGASMLIIDPLPSAMEDAHDLSSEAGCRAITDPCNKIASENQWHVLLTRHLRPNPMVDVRHAGYGHAALGNASRAIGRVDIDPNDRNRRLWSVVALNATKVRVTLAFTLRDSLHGACEIEWTGTSKLTAQQIAESQMDEVALDEMNDAQMVLICNLQAGPVKFVDLMREAQKYGVKDYGLRRAAKKLECTKHPDGSGPGSHMEWGPPVDGFPARLIDLANFRGMADTRQPFNQQTAESPKNVQKGAEKMPSAEMPGAPKDPPVYSTEEGCNGHH